jgi:5-(carboxyamino)imidazole ribonucleotide mutase
MTDTPLQTPQVGVVVDAEADLPKMQKAIEVLEAFGIPCEIRVLSAQYMLDRVVEYAKGAQARGLKVLIAGSRMSNHLAGALAAHTVLPVIGVPLSGSAFSGLDALCSTVQMPRGVPVATVAIDGAANAGYLAAEILSIGDSDLMAQLKQHRLEERRKIENTPPISV